MTYSARLDSPFPGKWELYVVIDHDRSVEWPVRTFYRVSTPPLKSRVKALSALGYEPIDNGRDWSWEEWSRPGERRVRLLASLDVRPIERGAVE